VLIGITGVEKLMNVLSRTIENKCLDVALSILGNCCMDEKCILRVNVLIIVQSIIPVNLHSPYDCCSMHSISN